MKKTKLYITLGVIATVLLIGVGSCVSVRNGIIDADQTVEQTWGNVQNQYQRRLDLIPNLVSTVKGMAQHEQNTLQGVTNARAGIVTPAAEAAELNPAVKQAGDELLALNAEAKEAGTAVTPAQLQNLERGLSIYVNAVHEAYPTLVAQQSFLGLQDELAGTENRIATERTRYNDAVKAYNNKILKFPGSIFAWGYEKKDYFEAQPGASIAPTVNF